MSFSQTQGHAKECIHNVEESLNIGHSKGGATSPILSGASTPGGAANMAKPAHETQQVGRLRAGINKPRTATDTLRRKYAASGK